MTAPNAPANAEAHTIATSARAEMLEAVIEQFPGGIALFDRHMCMIICNERLKAMLEYPAALFDEGPPSMERLFMFNAARGEYGPGDPTQQVAARLALARKPCAHVYERARPNGTVLEVRGAPLRGGGFITTYFDVTDRRRAQDLVAHMAHHDGLTGLMNRTSFLAKLRDAAAQTTRDRSFAVHYLDLDGFKAVNDRHGHAMGDALLIAVADRLLSTVRETDITARLGGDEFAILQAGVVQVSDALDLADRLIEKIGDVFAIEGTCQQIGVSIGISVSAHDGSSTPEGMLGTADAALYQSKLHGRGRSTLWLATRCDPLPDVDELAPQPIASRAVAGQVRPSAS